MRIADGYLTRHGLFWIQLHDGENLYVPEMTAEQLSAAIYWTAIRDAEPCSIEHKRIMDDIERLTQAFDERLAKEEIQK